VFGGLELERRLNSEGAAYESRVGSASVCASRLSCPVLKNRARRLVNAGGDMLVRMHDLQSVVSNYERILHKA
jgi:hypothetical protein